MHTRESLKSQESERERLGFYKKQIGIVVEQFLLRISVTNVFMFHAYNKSGIISLFIEVHML